MDAINCMIEIIDEPYKGDDFADYNLLRNKGRRRACFAFAQETWMLKEIGCKS